MKTCTLLKGKNANIIAGMYRDFSICLMLENHETGELVELTENVCQLFSKVKLENQVILNQKAVSMLNEIEDLIDELSHMKLIKFKDTYILTLKINYFEQMIDFNENLKLVS